MEKRKLEIFNMEAVNLGAVHTHTHTHTGNSSKIKSIKLMENTKQSQGITLITLVITIIVLLILSGITIVALTGDNGIIFKARKRKRAIRNIR